MGRLSLPSLRFFILLIITILSINILQTECRKNVLSHATFPLEVQNAIGCDICTYAMTDLSIQIQAEREYKKSNSLKLNEDDVLEIIGELCVPFTVRGEWIRRVALQIPSSTSITNNSENNPESDGFTKILDIYTSCKRTCRSVQEVCETMLESEEMDRLSAIILENSNIYANISDVKVINGLIRQVCIPTHQCLNHLEYKKELTHSLNTMTIHGTLLEQILSDTTEEVGKQLMELESMMYSAGDDDRKKPVIITKDDMEKLKKAYKSGDMEMAKEVDPMADDLSEEELEKLRHISDEEDGDM
ncbi:unnamed protein product [Phytomonas sp. Hart1]|nr:unnamed protein product [Phytomonas sp. Hart1]|eukprot:CCW69979.1 unnamed protein product [Phytomonas sp. isolate Hart1]